MPRAPRRTSPWRWLVLGAVVAVHVAALYWPRVPQTPADDLPLVDKAVHAVLFAAVLLAAAGARLPLRAVAVVLLGHAVVSELLQEHVLPRREGDPLDALADAVGLALAAAALRRAGRPGHVREDARALSG